MEYFGQGRLVDEELKAGQLATARLLLLLISAGASRGGGGAHLFSRRYVKIRHWPRFRFAFAVVAGQLGRGGRPWICLVHPFAPAVVTPSRKRQQVGHGKEEDEAVGGQDDG